MDEKEERHFDVNVIRKDFPVLEKKVYGKPLAYLDNAASAQKPRYVIDTLSRAYLEAYANVHRGLYYLANAATDAYEKARETVRHFLNAPSADTIVFTKNATEAINIVAYSWGLLNIRKDDEILVTLMEHHSNLIPWYFIRNRQQAKLLFVPIDANGMLHIEDFERMLTTRTRLVAITHMSNVLGTILPIKKMIAIAHARKIPVLVDGAQGAVHMPVNVVDLDCDWYAMSGHKLYGPTGIGVLYGKQEKLEAMHPFQGGGEMVEDVTVENATYNRPPYRFEAGTPPIVEAIGFGAALEYIERIGRDVIMQHESALSVYAHFSGIHAHDIAMYVDRQGVAIRAGTHCTQPLLKHLKITSSCRASLSLYNNRTDIDQLADALSKARRFFSHE